MNKSNDRYFEWLCDLVCRNRYDDDISYRDLIWHLYNREFTYLIEQDSNRASDGESLRYRYYLDTDMDAEIDRPCTVLEMLIALSIRCEEDIMDDPAIGDRTKQWFWNMIANMQLRGMYNDLYDPDVVDERLYILLNREYEPDGKGGLFYIRNCEYDLREVEIWVQQLWFLDTI